MISACSAASALANVPPLAYGLRNECLVSHEDTNRTKAGLLAGNLISRRDAEGAETGIHAVVLNREIHERHEKGAGFSYDKAGNLLAATNADATVSFVCDSMNRITSVTSFVSSVLSVANYSYDHNGNRTGLTLPGNKTIIYTYDDANRLSDLQLSSFSLQPFSFTYDAANRPTNIVYPNGVTAAYTYDEGGRLTGLTYTKNGSAFIDRAYTYNALGQITKRTISAGLEAVPSDTHQYLRHNAADQLTHVSRMDNYEQPERWRDVGPDYDANGAVTNIAVAYNGLTLENAFTWDYEGRLTAYSGEHQTNLWFTAPPIPEWLSFKYDALGGRVSRTAAVGGAKVHVLDQAAPLKNVLVQRASNGTIERYYIYAPGFGLVAHIDADGTARYYHGDHLGSTIALTDASGNVTDQFAYTPYGELMARTGAGNTDTPYTFCGRHGVYWEGGALYHMKARYYRADLARFISPDPLGIEGGVNLYAYANGDPVRFLDALGLCAESGDRYNSELWAAPPVHRDYASGEIRAPRSMAEIQMAGALTIGSGISPHDPHSSIMARANVEIAASMIASEILFSHAANAIRAIRAGRAVNNAIPLNMRFSRTVSVDVAEGIQSGQFTTLGRMGVDDVFITASDDIAGLSRGATANRLTIPQSDAAFRIDFTLQNANGVASPVFRSNPGFVQGGRAAGGAREFVIPNRSIGSLDYTISPIP